MTTVRLIVYFLAIVTAPLGAALLRVWSKQQAVSLGYQLHQAEQHSEGLRAELQKAEILRAAGRTPQRVGAMAKALGMGPAQASQVLLLRAQAPLPRANGREALPQQGSKAVP